MQILTIETDTLAHANFLAEFLCTVKSVKKVRIENNSHAKPSKRKETGKKAFTKNLVQEEKGEYNWVNPTRPATDAEIDQMLDKCEKSPLMTAQEAKAHTFKLIDKWSKEKK